MKRTYQTPAAMVVDVKGGNLLDVNSTQGNAGIKLGNGSNEVARGREASGWDDED